jgi:hypothetical protein
MIEITQTPKRYRGRTAGHVPPVLLVAVWGVARIGVHASQHGYVHTLFQTLAIAESGIALLLRRRKPVGALVGLLVAYLAFELDPLLLPALLFALFTVATLRERRTVLLATAASAATAAALPLTSRASVDLAACCRAERSTSSQAVISPPTRVGHRSSDGRLRSSRRGARNQLEGDRKSPARPTTTRSSPGTVSA